MTTKLEPIGNMLEVQPQSLPLPWKRWGVLSNPALERLWSRVRRYVLPAVCFPTWWTAKRTSRHRLDLPEHGQPSVILNEITRRM